MEDHMRPNLPSTSIQDNPDLVNPTAAVAGADDRMMPVAGRVPAPGAAGSESGPDQDELDALRALGGCHRAVQGHTAQP